MKLQATDVSIAPTVRGVNVNLLIPAVSFGRSEELVIRDGSIRLICSPAPLWLAITGGQSNGTWRLPLAWNEAIVSVGEEGSKLDSSSVSTSTSGCPADALLLVKNVPVLPVLELLRLTLLRLMLLTVWWICEKWHQWSLVPSKLTSAFPQTSAIFLPNRDSTSTDLLSAL